jgi:hypothetical protein
MATTKKPVSTVCSKAGRTLATVCRTKKVAVKAAPKAAVKKTVAKPAPKAVGKKTVSKPAGKVKVDRITIQWAEGNNSKYDKFPKSYSSFAEANKAVVPVYKDVVKNNGGYNKVKFVIYYKDGETYEGRLDVSPIEDNPTTTTNVFGLHIRDFAKFVNSPKGGYTFTDKDKKEINDFIKNYEL